MPSTQKTEMKLKGISGSPGICIGKAYLVDKGGVDIIQKYCIDEKCIQNEVNRFKTAVNKTKEELRAIIEETPEDLRQQAHIIETHVVLLEDKMLYGKTIDIIENECVNAEWALRKTVATVKPKFENMVDSYLKNRADDIDHVANRVMGHLLGTEGINISDIDKRVILVARDLSPAETSQIQLEKIKGFVTDHGGQASHTSIIAKTLEIPAVLGVANATRKIENDDIIILDGISGTIIVNPCEQTLIAAEDRKVRYEARKAVMARNSHLPAITTDGLRMKILGNIELPEEVVSVMDHGGEGIGLYRTEFQYLNGHDFPDEDTLLEKYQEVVHVMAGRPVTIRTLDINGDKTLAFNADAEEFNPALGLRGIRYCLKKQDIFRTQLRAILRAAAFGPIRLLFPMISTVEEVIEAKQILDGTAQTLEKEGIVYRRDIKVGIMIEVPSAVMTADLIAREVDFFSIGTNDLIQYTMAADRTNRDVAHLYQPLHPAVLRMINQVCTAADKAGIPTFMCGEMAADPLNIPVLLGLGIDELSMNPQSIPAAKAMIRALSKTECKKIAHEVLRQTRISDNVRLIEATFGKLVAESIYASNTGNNG